MSEPNVQPWIKVRQVDSVDDMIALVGEPQNSAESILLEMMRADVKQANQLAAQAEQENKDHDIVKWADSHRWAEHYREVVRAYVFSILIYREYGHE